MRRIARPLSRTRDNELHDEMPKRAIISLITSVPLTPYLIFLIINILEQHYVTLEIKTSYAVVKQELLQTESFV